MPDDDYLIRFKLYDVATGGSYLWQETQTVTTADGLFDVILGEVNSIGLPFDETYWLELQVGGDLVMEPRVQLTAVPYAIRALNADTAEDEDWVIDGDDIYPIDGQVAVGTTPPAKSEGEEEKGDRSESEAKLNVQGNETALYAQLEASDNTAMDRAGVYGVRHRITSNPGIGFAHGENNNAVLGLNTYGDTYTFGVAGYATLDSPWTAGVLGSTADGSTWGALGYRGGNTQPWGVYTPGAAYVGATLVTNFMQIPTDAQDGYVLTSDLNGFAHWEPAPTGTEFELPYSGSTSYNGSAFEISNTLVGATTAIKGLSTGAYGGSFEGGYTGVYGYVEANAANTLSYFAVDGEAAGLYGYVYGVRGRVTSGDGLNYGVYGDAAGMGGNYGVYGTASNGATNYAGYFDGNVHVNGTLSKSAGSFHNVFNIRLLLADGVSRSTGREERSFRPGDAPREWQAAVQGLCTTNTL